MCNEKKNATLKILKNKYRTRAIITRGSCISNPLFEVQKRFFKEVFIENLPLFMFSIQEWFTLIQSEWPLEELYA